MNSQTQAPRPGRVQLILSAKSSGPSEAAIKLASLPRDETQQRFTLALDSAVTEVFEMMVGISLGSCGQVTLPRVADYTAMIGLAGELCGVLSFRCSLETAAGITAKMLETIERPSQETIRDALGEICNMVAGSFKVRVSDLAAQCWLSVPTVVSGSDYQLYPLTDGMRMQVSRTFGGTLLWLTLDLHGN